MRSQPAQVLLIDDRPEIEVALAACLRKDAIQIQGVRDGRSGLDLAAEKRFDLILLDLEMPEMDGFEVLQRLKGAEATKPIPVIMLTGYDTLPDKVRSFELGASDYIVKPFHSAELRARVRAVLRTQQLNSLLNEAEKELADAQRALKEALAAKDRLVGIANDSLRAPLAGNQALASVLLQCGLNDHQADLVRTIQRNSRSTVEVLEDLVDFGLLQNGQMRLEAQPFDLRSCVEDALEALGPAAGDRGLDLACLWPDELHSQVVGDARRVRQIVLHLAGNAVRCTPEGSVVVRVGMAGPAAGMSVQSAHVPGASCVYHFAVTDTGVGIPPDRLERLFVPWGQERENKGRASLSSGLGLAICRGLAALHGGGMWAESTVGKGSTFHFTLSLAQGPPSAPAVPPMPGSMAGRALLVVDSCQAAREAVCQQARRLGLAASEASSIGEALDALAQGQVCDWVLVDAGSPEAGGLGLGNEIKRLALAEPPRVVLLTRPGQALSLETLGEGSVAATLVKPSRLASLREALVQATEGIRFSEEAARPLVLDPSLASRLPVRTLVIDGDPITQKILTSILRGFGYLPEVAHGGGEAERAMAAPQMRGIAFIDTAMDDFNAFDSTRQLRARERARGKAGGPPTIAIAMNESDSEEVRNGCLAAGMDDYLSKPPTVEAILNLLETWAPLAQTPEDASLAPQVPPASSEPRPAPTPRTPPTTPLPPTPEPPVAALAASAAGNGEAPVDFRVLLESAHGDWGGVFELIDLYLNQTEHRFEQLITAMSMGDAGEIESLARSGAGASETCGVRDLVGPLTQVQVRAQAGDLEGAEMACAEAIQEYERLRAFLDNERKTRLAPQGSPA